MLLTFRCLLLVIALLGSVIALADFTLSPSVAFEDTAKNTHKNTTQTLSNQLPDSDIGYGDKNIKRAWLALPTMRYAHGVLGDRLEAGQLFVETDTKRLSITLPPHRVFEDLQPRLVDIDQDGMDEVLLVESDTKRGASLAVYTVSNNTLVKRAATPFLEHAYRWLNPLGVGDFDGDGNQDVALVATPHIGGILRLYHLLDNQLVQFAQLSGVSTHTIGSTALGLGAVVKHAPRDRLLLPNQSRTELLLLEWDGQDFQTLGRQPLNAALVSDLRQIAFNQWHFQLANGLFYQLNWVENE